MLLQRPDRTKGNNTAHADVTQGGYVGAGGNLMRCALVVFAMAGKESDGHTVVFEDLERRGWVAPGREGIDGRNRLVAVDLGEASATYHGDVDGACKKKGTRSASLLS